MSAWTMSSDAAVVLLLLLLLFRSRDHFLLRPKIPFPCVFVCACYLVSHGKGCLMHA